MELYGILGDVTAEIDASFSGQLYDAANDEWITVSNGQLYIFVEP